MKYFKAFLIFISIFLIINLLSNTICYFSLINNLFNSLLSIISLIISSLISGLYIGLNSQNKGYLEGAKVGGIIISFMFLLSYLGFNNSFSIIGIIYYILILTLVITGSIIGINKKEKAK